MLDRSGGHSSGESALESAHVRERELENMDTRKSINLDT